MRQSVSITVVYPELETGENGQLRHRQKIKEMRPRNASQPPSIRGLEVAVLSGEGPSPCRRGHRWSSLTNSWYLEITCPTPVLLFIRTHLIPTLDRLINGRVLDMKLSYTNLLAGIICRRNN